MIQRHPDFWRLSRRLRDFILKIEPTRQLACLEELIADPKLAEDWHELLKKYPMKEEKA